MDLHFSALDPLCVLGKWLSFSVSVLPACKARVTLPTLRGLAFNWVWIQITSAQPFVLSLDTYLSPFYPFVAIKKQ